MGTRKAGVFQGWRFLFHFQNQRRNASDDVPNQYRERHCPVLQIAEGKTIELPEDVHNTINERTDPTWPTTWFVPNLTGKGPFKDVYSVMSNWGANHGAFTYGHIGADLITLASMLRIPVNMHNVPEDQIFRPSAWASFGMDPESSDYRACSTYKALYE